MDSKEDKVELNLFCFKSLNIDNSHVFFYYLCLKAKRCQDIFWTLYLELLV